MERREFIVDGRSYTVGPLEDGRPGEFGVGHETEQGRRVAFAVKASPATAAEEIAIIRKLAPLFDEWLRDNAAS